MSQQAHPPSTKPKVAVSYSWKEEREGGEDSKGAVDTFCDEIRKRGAEVLRDDERLRHGDSLLRFMQEDIQQARRFCIFLSLNYLKSPNCMLELCSLWKASGATHDQFSKTARVCLLPGFDVANLATADKWAAEWRQRLSSEEHPVMKSLAPLVDCIQPVVECLQVKLYKADLKDFADHIEDDLELRSLDPKELEQARAALVREIEGTISLSKKLMALFVKYPQLGHSEPAGFKISEAFRHSTSKVSPILLSLMRDPLVVRLPNSDKEAFLDIIGGIAALGVRPQWLAKQIQALAGEGGLLMIQIPTPSDRLTAIVSTIDDAQEHKSSISLLQVVSRSLLGRCIELEKLFQAPPLAVADRAMDRVLQTVGEVDEPFAIKLNLIGRITPEESTEKRTAESRDAYVKRVDRLFRSALKRIEFAYLEGYPWCLTDSAFAGRINLLRELGLHKVIVMLPKEGHFDDFFEDFTNAMSAVLKIHLMVKRS